MDISAAQRLCGKNTKEPVRRDITNIVFYCEDSVPLVGVVRRIRGPLTKQTHHSQSHAVVGVARRLAGSSPTTHTHAQRGDVAPTFYLEDLNTLYVWIPFADLICTINN
jgi:hypothetical protein